MFFLLLPGPGLDPIFPSSHFSPRLVLLARLQLHHGLQGRGLPGEDLLLLLALQGADLLLCFPDGHNPAGRELLPRDFSLLLWVFFLLLPGPGLDTIFPSSCLITIPLVVHLLACSIGSLHLPELPHLHLLQVEREGLPEVTGLGQAHYWPGRGGEEPLTGCTALVDGGHHLPRLLVS